MRQIFCGGGMNIIETPPTTRTLRNAAGYDYDYDSRRKGGKRGYNIGMPYVQYCQINSGLFVTFTNEPIKSFEDKLYPQPFSQTFDYGLTCLVIENVGEDQNNLKTLISMYYGTPFGYHLRDVPALAKFKNLDEWEKLTEKDPTAILKTKWWMKPCTIADMCTYASFPHLTVEHWARPFHGMPLAERLEHVKNKTVPDGSENLISNLNWQQRLLLRCALKNDEPTARQLLELFYCYNYRYSGYNYTEKQIQQNIDHYQKSYYDLFKKKPYTNHAPEKLQKLIDKYAPQDLKHLDAHTKLVEKYRESHAKRR